MRRGLAPNRSRARDAIDGGRVRGGGAPALRASRLVAPDEPVTVTGDAPRFVGRGGEKLAASLERFRVAVAGLRALDVGASTGGFTDCLLQNGAVEVVALDVGYGQLHERLRSDPRVVVRERVNVRDLAPGDLGPAFALIVADLSFISLRTVLDPLFAQAAPGANLILLVKPQFEAGRQEAARGRGVVRDPSVWRRVLGDVTAAIESRGAAIMGAMVSPLRGSDGNVEFILHLVADSVPDAAPATDLDALVAQARQLDGSQAESPDSPDRGS